MTSDLRNCCLTSHGKVDVSLDQFQPHLLGLLKHLLEKGECIVKSEAEKDKLEEIIQALGMGESLQLFFCPSGIKINELDDLFKSSNDTTANNDSEYIERPQSPAAGSLKHEDEKMASANNMDSGGIIDQNEGFINDRENRKRKVYNDDRHFVNKKQKPLLNRDIKSKGVDNSSINLVNKQLGDKYQQIAEETEIEEKNKNHYSQVEESDNKRQSRKQHQGEIDKPFHCSICSKKFIKSMYLKMHLKIHTGEKPYQRDTGTKKFSQKDNLLMYSRKIHPKENNFNTNSADVVKTKSNRKDQEENRNSTYISENEQTTSSINRQSAKVNTVGEIEEKKLFQCSICSKTFAHLAALNRHLKIHSGERPFECEVCAYKFRRKDHLQTHMKIHTGRDDVDTSLEVLIKSTHTSKGGPESRDGVKVPKTKISCTKTDKWVTREEKSENMKHGKEYIEQSEVEARRPSSSTQQPILEVGAFAYAKKEQKEEYEKCEVIEKMRSSRYKIRFEDIHARSKKALPQMIVTGNNLAYFKPPEYTLDVGTRCIAVYKEQDLTEEFYPAIVAETPSTHNSDRYLVFFDDGYADYLPNNDLRVMVDQQTEVWKEGPKDEEFIQNYLKDFPNNPFLRLNVGDEVEAYHTLTEEWVKVPVLDIDASLYLLDFGANCEWIYRGCPRLKPIQDGSLNMVSRDDDEKTVVTVKDELHGIISDK